MPGVSNTAPGPVGSTPELSAGTLAAPRPSQLLCLPGDFRSPFLPPRPNVTTAAAVTVAATLLPEAVLAQRSPLLRSGHSYLDFGAIDA